MSTYPTYRDLIPEAPAPEPPVGRWQTWKWRRARRKLEYRLFAQGGMWGSVEWCRVRDENSALGVW